MTMVEYFLIVARFASWGIGLMVMHAVFLRIVNLAQAELHRRRPYSFTAPLPLPPVRFANEGSAIFVGFIAGIIPLIAYTDTMIARGTPWLPGMPDKLAMAVVTNLIIVMQCWFLWKLSVAPERWLRTAFAWYFFVGLLACFS